MIDLHAHLLPGFDDGVRSIEEARELAREAAAEGVTTIAATPHVRGDYPTRPERMERAVQLLNEDFAEHGIDVRVVAGGELDLQRLWELPPDEVRRFTYGGTCHWALVEFPYAGWPPLLERSVELLASDGIRCLVAHPERNNVVQEDPLRLQDLVAAGVWLQVTAASVTGALGGAAKVASEQLLVADLVHVLATDAHGPHLAQRRGLGAAAAAAAALTGDLARGRVLTEENPAEVLR